MSKGSVWNRWDFHLHTPYSVLNSNFGDPTSEETWENYVAKIESEAAEKEIVAIGITDYFTIDGYKKIIEFKKKGRLNNIFLFPNIEFRLDKVITINKEGRNPESKRLNFHVIFSPEVPIEEIEENFLHELEFIHEEDPFTSGEKFKLRKKRLEEFGRRLKENHEPFKDSTDLYVGCLTAVVSPEQIKETLNKVAFKGKYLMVLAEESMPLLYWNGQCHAIRKQILQMSHAVFSSNSSTINFCLGKKHENSKKFIHEFKSIKPCIWGCDSHSFKERFLEPDNKNFCWIKSETSWDGLKQILYEPEERVKIQELNPETQKSIYTLNKLQIEETKINNSLKIDYKEFDLNHNLIAIIGGRGSGKTAILDIIASCFKDGSKLEQIETSFISRLKAKGERNSPIPVKIETILGGEFSKKIGEDSTYFEASDILYITQNHFEKFSGDYTKLNRYVLELIFDKYPEFKDRYQKFEQEVGERKTEIQLINLNIEQLNEKIEGKDYLDSLLRQKNGEKLDCENRIREIEKKSEVCREIDDLMNELNVQRNKKRDIESVIYRIEQTLLDAKKLSEYITGLQEINRDITTFRQEYISLQVFPGNELSRCLEVIKTVGEINKRTLKEKIDEISGKIQNTQRKLQEFDDVNKTITELKEKAIYISEEIDKINFRLKKITEYELEVNDNKKKRLECYGNIIKTHLEWKNQINNILEEFEEGKDQILDNLTFCASIGLEKDEYLKAINGKINHQFISENELNNEIEGKIISLISEIINKSSEKDIDKIYLEPILYKNIDLVSERFFEMRKKGTTYSDYHNKLLVNMLRIEINIKLDNIPLENQSMGQRAIVLLKIILAYDDKPLIIDQPEEDLDNSYIYEHLVSAFRIAKKKRQIIIATHNANLVVNTDAEQIIIAKHDNKKISYTIGTLENSNIRNIVKTILEGGDEAFRKREEKYGYKF